MFQFKSNSKSSSDTQKQNSKKQKDIRFPLFFEAASFLEDQFWANFLIDLSRGKCPKKVVIDNTSIHIGPKRHLFTYFYCDKSPKQIATDLKPIFIEQLNIVSNTDLKTTNEEIEDSLQEFIHHKEENEWKKIKNKKMRDNLIDYYVLSKRKHWNLNWKQTRELQTLINNAFYIYRTHKSKDVIMTNGQIHNILDITYDNINHQLINNRVHLEQLQDNSCFGLTENRHIGDIWISYIKLLSDDASLKMDHTQISSLPIVLENEEEI